MNNLSLPVLLLLALVAFFFVLLSGYFISLLFRKKKICMQKITRSATWVVIIYCITITYSICIEIARDYCEQENMISHTFTRLRFLLDTSFTLLFIAVLSVLFFIKQYQKKIIKNEKCENI
jgi:uncharacterized membrane protein